MARWTTLLLVPPRRQQFLTFFLIFCHERNAFATA